jgi:hypothetical protein
VYSKTDVRAMWIAEIRYDINFVVAIFESVVGMIISASTGYNKLAGSSGHQGLYDDQVDILEVVPSPNDSSVSQSAAVSGQQGQQISCTGLGCRISQASTP